MSYLLYLKKTVFFFIFKAIPLPTLLLADNKLIFKEDLLREYLKNYKKLTSTAGRSEAVVPIKRANLCPGPKPERNNTTTTTLFGL